MWYVSTFVYLIFIYSYEKYFRKESFRLMGLAFIRKFSEKFSLQFFFFIESLPQHSVHFSIIDSPTTIHQSTTKCFFISHVYLFYFLQTFQKFSFRLFDGFERYSSFVRYFTVKWKRDEMILHERFTRTKKKKNLWNTCVSSEPWRVGRTLNYSPLDREY